MKFLSINNNTARAIDKLCLATISAVVLCLAGSVSSMDVVGIVLVRVLAVLIGTSAVLLTAMDVCDYLDRFDTDEDGEDEKMAEISDILVRRHEAS